MHTATILGRSINTEFIDEGTLFYGKTNWRKHQADYDGLIGPGSTSIDRKQNRKWCRTRLKVVFDVSSEDSTKAALRDIRYLQSAHIPFIVIGNKVDLTPDLTKHQKSEEKSENLEKIETLTRPNFIQCSAKEENVEIRKAFSHLYYQGL